MQRRKWGVCSVSDRKYENDLVWWLMGAFFLVIVGTGGAWATNINTKVDKIVGLETTVSYMQRDLSEIKVILKEWTNASR